MDQDTRNERRRPRIEVQHLRRDLRDADEDRYHLTSQLEQERRGRSTSNRLLGAMIFIAGGLTSALWLTLPMDPVTARRSEPVALPDRPLSAAPTQPESLLGQFESELAVPAFVGPLPAGQAVERAHRPARRSQAPTARPADDTRRPRLLDLDRGRNRDRVVTSTAPPPRPRPRPLSPGEFGRQAASL